MEIEETEKIIEKLESIQQLYGIGGTVLIIFLVVWGILLWTFLIKKIEKAAEELSEKNLKTFQSRLDKSLVKFSTRHHKQIDAIHECYQKFQELQALINFVFNGEPFTAQMKPDEELNHLSRLRLEFKRSYNKNKIIFPVTLNEKIESLFPEIDTFIKDYSDGILPILEDHYRPEGSDELYIGGIWPMGKLEQTLEKMDEISKEIELEFRKIYGTD